MPDASSRKASPFWSYLAFGILIEVLLVMIGMGLPPDSAPAIHLRNFVIITHYPLLWIAEALPFGELLPGPIAIGLLGLLMALFWALVLYWVSCLYRWFRSRILKSRRQKVIVGVLVGLACLLVAAQIVLNTVLAIPRPFTKSPAVDSLVQSNTVFAVDLYQKLRSQPGNLFFSPFAISTSLAMVSTGARGQTADEIAAVLHLTPGKPVSPACRTLMERLNNLQRWNRISLLMANGLWCDQSHPLEDAFVDTVRSDYQAEVRTLDFAQPSKTADTINDWIAGKTAGRIEGAVTAGQITPDTRLILADAMYFKGKWLHRFKTGDTRPAPFMVSTNQTVTVPMLWQSVEVKTVADIEGAVELLELPYLGNDLSMIILLPGKTVETIEAGGYDLSVLEEQLTAENLRAWLAKLDAASLHKTSVWLPRFTTTQNFNLVDTLKSLGLKSVFNSDSDFSGIDGKKDLYISDFLQKTFVKVDEAGTEAAAITLELVKSRGMSDRFNADHPFIFLIRDNGSGSILFLGRIVDPTK